MKKVSSYLDLDVWREAMDLVEGTYRLTRKLPASERFGLCSQLERAAVSVASNIAEGHERPSTRDFLRHLGFSLGSLAEWETQLEIVVRLGYVEPPFAEPLRSLGRRVGRMLRGLQKALTNRLRAARPTDSPLPLPASPRPPTPSCPPTFSPSRG
ncbi:MAG: four helix bundle protein [Deltaproteobacteria bacterium]|nr:four helix bundle protein [Deltaproteobacteria bacterium]